MHIVSVTMLSLQLTCVIYLYKSKLFIHWIKVPATLMINSKSKLFQFCAIYCDVTWKCTMKVIVNFLHKVS